VCFLKLHSGYTLNIGSGRSRSWMDRIKDIGNGVEVYGGGVVSIVSPPSSRPVSTVVPPRILLNYTVNHQYNNTPFVHRSRLHCGRIVIPYNTTGTERFIKQWMSFFVSGLTRSIINNADILSATASAANRPISRPPTTFADVSE